MTVQSAAAKFTKIGVKVMVHSAAAWASVIVDSLRSAAFNQLRAINTGGYCNDAVTHNHNDRRNHLAKRGLGRYVAISNGRNGYNSPVDAFGNTGKACFRALNDVHQRPEDHNQGYDCIHKYQDFLYAIGQ